MYYRVAIQVDHTIPYRFTLPNSMPEVLAWVKLMVRVRDGDVQL